MSKKQPSDLTNEAVGSFLLGGSLAMLPKELEAMGLLGKVGAQEIPGVCPTWKPVKAGDFLIGRAVQMRDHIGKFDSSALVFETAVPGGFRTVFLSADLKIKFADSVGKTYAIYYDGEVDMPRGKMKTYRVYEVFPTVDEPAT